MIGVTLAGVYQWHFGRLQHVWRIPGLLQPSVVSQVGNPFLGAAPTGNEGVFAVDVVELGRRQADRLHEFPENDLLFGFDESEVVVDSVGVVILVFEDCFDA